MGDGIYCQHVGPKTSDPFLLKAAALPRVAQRDTRTNKNGENHRRPNRLTDECFRAAPNAVRKPLPPRLDPAPYRSPEVGIGRRLDFPLVQHAVEGILHRL